MEKLLRYFMEQTNERFNKVDQKLEDLTTFKASMIASAKAHAAWISVVITGAGGLITLLVTVWASRK